MKLRATYANVAATAALVLSLGGTAYAATVITSANIKDGTIQSVDVADGALLSRDVHDGTLGGVDVLNGSLTGADVKDGSLGLADLSSTTRDGLKGPKGDPGAPGGISGYEVKMGAETFGTVSDTISAYAMCPAGKKPISGGWISGTNNLPLDVRATHPRTLSAGEVAEFPAGGEAWQVDGHEVWSTYGSTADWHLTAWAVCAYVQ